MSKVLIVDDQQHMRQLLAFNLKRSGAEIFQAASGREALNQIKSNKMDLLIIDVVMDDLDGFETVRLIRKDPQYEDLPVIMLTARGQLETKSEAESLGISAFLTKPFSPAKLLEVTRNLIRN